MGSGMAATLLRNMVDLTVFDINRKAVIPAVRQGAVEASGIADVVTRCDKILLSLPNSETTVKVFEEEILPNMRKAQIIIDTGTTVVEETLKIGKKIENMNAFLVDAPVSGGSVGAAAGKLYVFAGGEKSAVKEVWDILSMIGGSKVTYCGKGGNGQITKGVNQLAMGVVDAAFLECIAYGVSAGVDVAVLREAVGGDEGFRKAFSEMAEKILWGEGEKVCCKFPEYKYFLKEADRQNFDAPILRCLNNYMCDHKKTHRDNMNRPYPPLWSLLY